MDGRGRGIRRGRGERDIERQLETERDRERQGETERHREGEGDRNMEMKRRYNIYIYKI